MPLFLARGQPERLQNRKLLKTCAFSEAWFTVAVCLSVISCTQLYIIVFTNVPPVGGIVSSDVSRSITAGRWTPEA